MVSKGASLGTGSASGPRPLQQSTADLPQSRGRAAGSPEAEELAALNTLPSQGPGCSRGLLLPPSPGLREALNEKLFGGRTTLHALTMQASNKRAADERQIEVVESNVRGHLSPFFLLTLKVKNY